MIDQQGRCNHRSKIGRDAVGSKVLRQRGRIFRNGFGEGAGGGYAIGQPGRCERSTSCSELQRVAGL